jgi:hypothetical protein
MGRDVEAICEAAPAALRFVLIKHVEQQALRGLHRARQRICEGAYRASESAPRIVGRMCNRYAQGTRLIAQHMPRGSGGWRAWSASQ